VGEGRARFARHELRQTSFIQQEPANHLCQAQGELPPGPRLTPVKRMISLLTSEKIRHDEVRDEAGASIATILAIANPID
jgi:hypothetical protein